MLPQIINYLLNDPTGNFALLLILTGIPAVVAQIVLQPRPYRARWNGRDR